MKVLAGERPDVRGDDRSPRSTRPELWSSADRHWDRLRASLIVGWLLVLAATALVGERVASWDDVRGLVAAGEVTSVRISGELPADATGYGTVEVHWRQGLLRHTAEVIEVRGRGERPTADGATVVRTSPSGRLLALRPGLHITRDQEHPGGGPLFGWQVPNALGLPSLLLFLAGFALLVAGPQPWRATRWAWFWLLVPPLGSIVFLVLSGPTPGIPRPRTPRRRLTGGWAFLLSFPLMALLAPYHW